VLRPLQSKLLYPSNQKSLHFLKAQLNKFNTVVKPYDTKQYLSQRAYVIGNASLHTHTHMGVHIHLHVHITLESWFFFFCSKCFSRFCTPEVVLFYYCFRHIAGVSTRRIYYLAVLNINIYYIIIICVQLGRYMYYILYCVY